RADAIAVEKHARAASVLASHHIRVAQRRQHAQRDVLEVPDRRRAHHEAPAQSAPTPSNASAAAPSIPASTPNSAITILTSSLDGGSARERTSARAGSSSNSPAAITPPPITTTCRLKMLTKLAIATPSRVPIR